MAEAGEEDDAASLVQAAENVVEEMPSGLVDRDDVAKVEDEALHAEAFREGAHDVFGGGEDEIALELEDLDAAALRAEDFVFRQRTDAAGIELRRIEAQADDGFADAGPIEEMQVPTARERAAHPETAHAVALGIERRRIDADAELAGQDGEDSAGRAAFRRHAHVVEPFARVIVHPASAHHAEDAFDEFAADGLFPGERIDAAIGQRGGHGGQVAAMGEDRTLLEIGIDDRHGVFVEHVEIAQHVADGPVAMPRGVFGLIDGLVDLEFPPGETVERRENAREANLRSRAGHQTGAGDGAGIDHRIARAAGFRIEGNGIEGIARGFDADFFQDLGAALIFEREAVDKGLRDGLDREFLPGIAGLVNAAIGRDDTDAKPLRIGPGQLRDMGRDLALGNIGEMAMQFLELIANGGRGERGFVGSHGASGGRVGPATQRMKGNQWGLTSPNTQHWLLASVDAIRYEAAKR